MQKLFHVLQIVLLVTALFFEPHSVFAQSYATAVDALFASYNSPKKPGATLVVVRNGAVEYKAAYGAADIRSKRLNTTATAFHIASVGKQMTATAILLLQAAGKLSVDDKVVQYLPQFRRWGKSVTIRQLLLHTGGLYDYYQDIEDHYRLPTNAQALRYLAKIGRLEFRPGGRHDYSNSGYDMLGNIIEKVSGKSFPQFMEEQIFTPAGMTSSFAFDRSRRAAALRAIGYARERGRYVVDDRSALNLIHGSGSIYSTVEDMARYDKALFGHELLTEEQLSEAFQQGRLNSGRLIEYGFGWELFQDTDVNESVIAHSGEWMGFASYYLHYPDRNLSVIVLANCSATDVEALAFRVGHLALASQ